MDIKAAIDKIKKDNVYRLAGNSDVIDLAVIVDAIFEKMVSLEKRVENHQHSIQNCDGDTLTRKPEKVNDP